MSTPSNGSAGAAAARVCVVIPVYRASLPVNERLSLTQCLRVLGRHPIVLVTPESLDLSQIEQEFGKIPRITFPDRYFQGIRGYNELMLSEQFYERFQAYEFILVHQLDAFVFADSLLEWCADEVDYVGAPWVSERALRSRAAIARTRLKGWLFDRLEITDQRNPGQVHRARLLLRAGNGGLSLRRVSAFLHCLRNHREQVRGILAAPNPANEDVFFSVLLHRKDPRLHIPDYRRASRFAVELCPRLSVEGLNGGQLPFGCHGWDRYHTEYWRGLFAQAGYPLGSALNPRQYYVNTRPELKPFIPEAYTRVLEIGCGGGAFRGNLRADAEVWGVEPVADAAAEAARGLTRVLHGLYDQVSADLPDGYFDLVICNDVIEHMVDDEAFLRDVQRKMAPGAHLMGSIPNVRHWPVLKALIFDREWEYVDQGVLDRTHLRFYTIRSLPRLLQNAGFEVVRLQGINRTIGKTTRRLLRLLGPKRFDDVGYIQFAFLAKRRLVSRT